jgi:hypothetical protein
MPATSRGRGDQDHRHAEVRAYPADQLNDLRLDRHVERRGWLVGQKNRRIVCDRDRNDDALAHAPRELVRILAKAVVGLRNPDQPEEVDRPRTGSGPSNCRMLKKDLGNLRSDRYRRV